MKVCQMYSWHRETHYTALKIRTITWQIEDYLGCASIITLPNPYYAPNAPCCLLLPQHLSQTVQDNTPSKKGIWCATYANCLKLCWDQWKYKYTVHLDLKTNVAIVCSAPSGHTCFINSCTIIKDYGKQVAFPSTIDKGMPPPNKNGVALTKSHILQEQETTPRDPWETGVSKRDWTGIIWEWPG